MTNNNYSSLSEDTKDTGFCRIKLEEKLFIDQVVHIYTNLIVMEKQHSFDIKML